MKNKFSIDKFINKHEFQFLKKGYIIVERRKINSNYDIRIKQYLMKNKLPIDKSIINTNSSFQKSTPKIYHRWKKKNL